MSHCNKKMLSFFLTTRCNLCCVYCYNAAERNAIKEVTLPIEAAKAGIDWYFSNNDSRHIRFYGPGEPTQAFNLMREITKYARQHPNRGNQVTTEIQTNGVFTESTRDWILENCNIVWMSFDGMREIQNSNRPLNPRYANDFDGRSSAEVLEDNVRWLIDNQQDRNIMVGARVTITDNNVERQREMVDYFSGLGIRYIWTNPLFHSVGRIPVCEDEIKKKHFHFDMDRYVDFYLDANLYARSKGVFWGSFLAVNFDGRSEYHCRCCTPLEAPHLTPDGYVSACDMVLMGKQPYHMTPFIVGKWDDKTGTFLWEKEKIEVLNGRKSTMMTHCEGCIAQLNCGGYCLGETLNETGSLYGQNSWKCRGVRRLYAALGECEPYPYLHP